MKPEPSSASWISTAACGAATALALDAAVFGLPMADSLTYATARRHGAVIWTQDAHFDGLPGVRCFAKPRS